MCDSPSLRLLALVSVVLWAGPARGQPQPEVIDVRVGDRGSAPQHLTSYNDRLVFQADDGVTGKELWSYDGDTLTLVDILPGADGSHPTPTFFGYEPFPEYQESLYFSASDETFTYDLWRYDATGAATKVAVPIDVAPETFALAYDELLFRYQNGGFGIHELWHFDGSVASQLTGEIVHDNYTEYAGKLYFSSQRGDLLAYDGEHVTVAFDAPGTGLVSFANMVVFQDVLYFVTHGSMEGQEEELWRYDGSVATQVTDLFVNTATGIPRSLTVFGDQLCFTASTEATGQELWCYDGTTLTLHDIVPGPSGSDPRPEHRWLGTSRPFHEFAGKLYFRAATSTGSELWSFDGTAPALAADINTGGASSSPKFFVTFEDALYFQARHGLAGDELWRFDGTNASLVVDLIPGSTGSRPEQFVVHQGDLYFVADDDIHGKEVFRLPGSNAPPVAVDDDAATAENTPVDIDVLANDSDPDGDALTIESFTQPANGQVADAVGGALTYTPTAGFSGSDGFAYTIADGNGGTASATVTVTITPGALLLAISELVEVRDTPSLLPSLLLTVIETIGVADEPGLTPALVLAIQETIGVTDSPALLPALLLSVQEQIGVTDQPDLLLPLLLAVEETIGVSDRPNLLPALLLAVAESIGVTDDPALTPALLLAIREAIAVADDPELAAALLLRIQELITVSEAFGALLGVDGLITTLEASVADLITTGVLTRGKGQGLLKKLDQVRKKVEREQYNTALNVLNAFTNQVEQYLADGTLTEEQATGLLSQAHALRTAIEQLMEPAEGLEAPAASSKDALPTEYALDSAYPNPFNRATIIAYALPEDGEVRLTVYDALGRKVAVLVDRMQTAGFYAASFNASGLASGMYLYRIEAGPFAQTGRMLLVK